MRRLRSFAAVFGALFAVAAMTAADGGQYYFGATNSGSPTFFRPVGSGPGQSASAVHYQVQTFELANATRCFFYGQQDYDGYLHLYEGSFNSASPLTNLVAGDDDADLGVGTSQLEDLNLSAGSYVLVNSAFNSGAFGNFSTAIHCEDETPPLGAPCNGFTVTGVPNENIVCLNNRFIVAVDSVTNSGQAGLGVPVRVASNDSGIFWFYSPTNIELIVKVLNGCGVNNRWWVFGAALTNQGYRLLIGDTENPGLGLKAYSNSFGNQAPAITDVNAFATCP